jgi:hypothetical protein
LKKSITAIALSMVFLGGTLPARAGDNDELDPQKIKHVLLISVDGFHALDLANYVASHPKSTLAALSASGFTYTNDSTSTPSDSFPGLSALVTGGSPITAGFWYDVTWNRAVAAQALPNPKIGSNGGPCPAALPGAVVEYDEGIDKDLTRLDGGGGIDTQFLPRNFNTCAPIFPHEYLRVNTIFEVVKSHGLRTAWTDKHPSYEWTNGPSGKGVDDFYGPEINSIPVALPQFPGCDPVPYEDDTVDDGWTNSFYDIQCYDNTHVEAVLNQIDGWTHDRKSKVGVPALFGTNFQAVSVGEKLKVDPMTGQLGGYADVLGTPNDGMALELDYIDKSLGKFVAELKKEGIYDSTLIIVGAKHGQSPIDITKRRGIGGGQPQTTIGTPEAFDISDDGSLIWLTDPSLYTTVVQAISAPAAQDTLGIQEIFAGQSLYNKFNKPAQDPRTPDIILKVNTGVIFTGGTKIAEHGGFNEDDVHVALLVSNPGLGPKVIKSAVTNQQVAATIVKVLGADPKELDAVRAEQIHVLPFLLSDGDSDDKK